MNYCFRQSTHLLFSANFRVEVWISYKICGEQWKMKMQVPLFKNRKNFKDNSSAVNQAWGPPMCRAQCNYTRCTTMNLAMIEFSVCSGHFLLKEAGCFVCLFVFVLALLSSIVWRLNQKLFLPHLPGSLAVVIYKGFLVVCFAIIVFLSYVCIMEPRHCHVGHLNLLILQINSRLIENNGRAPLKKKK